MTLFSAATLATQTAVGSFSCCTSSLILCLILSATHGPPCDDNKYVGTVFAPCSAFSRKFFHCFCVWRMSGKVNMEIFNWKIAHVVNKLSPWNDPCSCIEFWIMIHVYTFAGNIYRSFEQCIVHNKPYWYVVTARHIYKIPAVIFSLESETKHMQ